MAEAIDAQIEFDMKVMQEVIVNGRAIRDRHNLSMRTPLPEVTLVHKDAAALASINRLTEYVAEELNVRSVKTALVSEVHARVIEQPRTPCSAAGAPAAAPMLLRCTAAPATPC